MTFLEKFHSSKTIFFRKFLQLNVDSVANFDISFSVFLFQISTNTALHMRQFNRIAGKSMYAFEFDEIGYKTVAIEHRKFWM